MSNGSLPPSVSLATIGQQHRAQLPAHLQQRLQGMRATELGEGITQGFAVVSLRGKAWRIKHRGEERTLMDTVDPRRPRYSLSVVLVKASPNISKIWYESGYTEGSNSPPDCWSVDGKVPDRASPKRQSETCAGCKWNAWGSSRTQGGTGKGKDCADSKRLAIAPSNDVRNEALGGPMLLRIPPASLGELASYSQKLMAMGLNYFEVVTEMSFDPQAEYPRVQFREVGMLDAKSLEDVVEMYTSPALDRILAAPIERVQTDGVDQSHTPPAVPPVPGQQAAQGAPSAFAPAPTPTPAPAPAALAPVPATPAAPTPAPTPITAPSAATDEDPRFTALKAAGLSGDMLVNIAKANGIPVPEPKVEPVDPRYQSLIDNGLMGDVLHNTAKALGIPVPSQAPPQPSPAPAPVPVPAPVAAQSAPAPAPAPLPQAPLPVATVTSGGNEFAAPNEAAPARPVEAPPAAVEPPKVVRPRKKPEVAPVAPPAPPTALPTQAEAASKPTEADIKSEEKTGDLPAGFDNMLDNILSGSAL